MNMREKIRKVLEDECYVGPYTSDRAVDAVLSALEEPTEGMYQAGEVELGCHQIFTAMIRAAKEGK